MAKETDTAAEEEAPRRRWWHQHKGCCHGTGGHNEAQDGQRQSEFVESRDGPLRSESSTSSVEGRSQSGAVGEGPPLIDLTTPPSCIGKADEADTEPLHDETATSWDSTAGHTGVMHRGMMPGADLRALARDSTHISWERIECWLTGDFESLRFAAGARNLKNLRMWLSHILSTIQILQTAVTIADGGAALWDEKNSCWSWSQKHVEETFRQRSTLFAWHCVAERADELGRRWGIDRVRTESIKAQMRERMGFTLQPTSCAHPDIEKVLERRREGMATILVRVELVHFQRRALLALPSEIGLHRMLTGALAGRKSKDGLWLYDETGGVGPCDVFELPDWEGGMSTLVYVRNEKVVGIFNHKGFKHEKPRRPQSSSRFMAEQVNWKERKDGDKKRSAQTLDEAAWPSVCKPIPEFDVTRVAARVHTWVKRLPDVGMAAKVILEGRLALPLKSADVQGFDLPNLPTCDEAPDLIDALVAEYLICGVLEYCPPGFEPRCVSPLGLVPKKTAPFYRLIVDLRKVNLYHAEWKTHMSGLAANAMAFNPGAVAFSRDLKSAYLLSGLGGCQPGLHKGDNPKRIKVQGQRRMRIGCDPESCSGGCNKSFFGIRWRDQLYRYASPCFGSKHGGNVLETLVTPVMRKVKTFGCELISWVDDWLVIVQNYGGPDHNPRACGGEQKCVHCKETFVRAREIEERLDQELDALGLLTSDKNAPPAQQGDFLGLSWDTVQGSFILSHDKAQSLSQQAYQLLQSESPTPREMAKWRGKLQWYAPCLEGTRILTKFISIDIGAPDEAGWDERKPIGAKAREELQFWADNLPGMAGQAKPMWKLSPQETLRRFKAGESVVDACLSTDASFMGWGAVLEFAGGREPLKASGRWQTKDDSSEQAHREACGTVRAVEAFLAELQGKTVLHLTDCIPVAQAIGKGSRGSEVLHNLALDLWRLCTKWSIHVSSLWIPGDCMVELGVDELSRELTVDRHDVRVTDRAWADAVALAEGLGMRLTVDWFADPRNRRLPRFWSKEHSVGAEGVDALRAASWGRVFCPECRLEHDQGAWLFPPIPLISLVVAKLKTDRAHGVILVPHRPDTTWWTVLRQGCGKNIRSLPHELAVSTASLDEPNTAYSVVGWRLCCFDFAADSTRCYPGQCRGGELHAGMISPEELGHKRFLQSLLVFKAS
jgi:hypothetical protein